MAKILLVADTSGKHGSVALIRANDRVEGGIEVMEEAALAGGTFSAQLVPQIAALLANQGVHKTDIAGFIVVSGPGSFTGLRVGLAAIKGLAEILQKPIVAVSLLEVLARAVPFAVGHSGGESGYHYAVALDGGRAEAFVGRCEIRFDGKGINSLKVESESLLSLQMLADLLESGSVRWIVTPDGSLADSLRGAGITRRDGVLIHARPQSREIAAAGWQKLQAGESVAPEQLDANYIRRSDAEIFSKPSS